MIIYQCKMCGGKLNIEEGSKIVTCEYCQTQQTVPTTDDEKIVNLYNRANYFRQNNEFDKAMGIYEHILAENSNDAEAYWSIVLCKYGIDYVKDPVSKRQMPTVNRTQSQSVLQDADYLMALEHADYEQKSLYEQEATEIDRIQKDILKIAQKEEPYDIFISYKEKAVNGERTKSSVLAQDIYNHLIKEGYRVFFSRVSLEDKVGQKYEPYIYSALNSSKVMLVIGTKKEEFTAPWVRNEWNRFLVMMREDANKLLIPCFRDIYIDDLPDEFQILQSQDMSKIGFEQDLLYGISKVFSRKSDKMQMTQTIVNNSATPPLDRLLKNAETYINLQNYQMAFNVYKQITNTYPESYEGWWGLIRADSEDFDKRIYTSEDIQKYEQWFMYVKKLSTKTIYENKLEDYLILCGKMANSLVQNEKKEVENIIHEYQNRVNDEKTKLSGVISEESRLRYEYIKKNKELQNQIEEKKEEEDELQDERDRIKRSRLIGGVVLFNSALLMFFVNLIPYDSESEFYNLLLSLCLVGMIGTVIGLVWVVKSFKSECISDIETDLYRVRNAENINEEQIRANNKEEEMKRQTFLSSKNRYNSVITGYEEKIAECEGYLNTDIDRITDFHVSKLCKHIGVDKECDEELLQLQNRIFGRGVNKDVADEKKPEESKTHEVICGKCGNVSQISKKLIRKGNNPYKCPGCGQVMNVRVN